ncbi:MAG: aldo/keto reductase [Chloroflexota bacterium]|nr:aldo/keto reductase [Anaerolineales bacterium]MCB8967757.1 aldo/keto reductase [Ardenticatenaceae bacterium]
MKQRELGKTGLTVTPLGLGLAALGRPGYINLGHATDLEHNYDVAAMEAHTHTVLDAAWAAGIRYFDAARSYGRAEQFLSTWLHSRQIDPAAVTVGSKWGYTYTADWQIEADKHEIKEHSLPVLQRQTGESLALLNGYLKLYQIHSATLDSGVLENKAVIAELSRLKAEQGLKIGLSLSGSAQAETLRRALGVRLFDGSPLFDAVQATWNLLEPSTGPALAEASAEGLGVIIKEAVANGRLTPRNTNPDVAILRQAAADRGVTSDALALAAVLAQPWVDIVLSGAAQIEHLHANVKALEITWDETLAEQLAALAEPPHVYWQKRSDLAWN